MTRNGGLNRLLYASVPIICCVNSFSQFWTLQNVHGSLIRTLFIILRIIYEFALVCYTMKQDTQALYIFFLLLLYGPFSLALAFFIIDAHSSLSNAFVFHRFTPSFLSSSSTSFIHPSLGCPLPLCPNFPRNIFFADLVLFILITCLSYYNLRIYITFTISWALYLVINTASKYLVHLYIMLYFLCAS